MATHTQANLSSEMHANTNQALNAANTVSALVSQQIILRISVPGHGLQKAVRCTLTDTVWSLKKQLIDKLMSEVPNCMNFGLFIPASLGKQGKFMEEKRELSSYMIENNSAIDFIPKCRLVSFAGANHALSESDLTASPSSSAKKKNKKLAEDVSKGNIDKVKEKLKSMDPNFWVDEEGRETALSLAVMNEDKEMIMLLVEMGAHIDFRLGAKDQWKSPLHIAAIHNKSIALKTLLSLGAWSNILDSNNTSPLYYSATNGHIDSVHRLLVARANTEVFDENGKGPLHQSCLTNHHQVCWLLVDFGADMNAKNVAGNTALHVAASRNSVDCAQVLALRGASREILNKTFQSPLQTASISQSEVIFEFLRDFKDEDIILPPPKPQLNDNGDIYSCSNSATESQNNRLSLTATSACSSPSISSPTSIKVKNDEITIASGPREIEVGQAPLKSNQVSGRDDFEKTYNTTTLHTQSHGIVSKMGDISKVVHDMDQRLVNFEKEKLELLSKLEKIKNST